MFEPHLAESLRSVFQSLGAIACLFLCLGAIGYLGHRALAAAGFVRPLIKLRAVTFVCMWMTGLRLASVGVQLSSALGARLSVLVPVVALVGIGGIALAGADLAAGRLRRTSFNHRLLLPALAFFSVLLIASLFSPPTQWDEYTHWLILPHEMVLANSFLSLNQQTNSVAPEYSLHLPFIAAVLMREGLHDGRLNAINVVLVGFTTVICTAVMRLCLVDRNTRFCANFLGTALFTASVLTFGFFYGDALLLLGIALAMLGLARIRRDDDWRASVLSGLLMSAPLVGKGYGHLVALGAAAIVVGVALLCGVTRAWRSPRARAAVLAAIFVLVERVMLYRVTVHPLEDNATLSMDSSLRLLRELNWHVALGRLTLFANHRDRLLFIVFVGSTILALAVFSAIAGKTNRPLDARGLSLVAPALALLAILVVSVLVRPDIEGSLPRYSFALAPAVAIIWSLLVREARIRSSSATLSIRSLLLLAGAAVFWLGESGTYIASFFPISIPVLTWHVGNDPEAPEYLKPLAELGARDPSLLAKSKRYLLLNERYDPALSFRMMSYFSEAGYRGHLFTETHTSRSHDRGERLGAARTALKQRNFAAFQESLRDIDVIVLNVAPGTFGRDAARVIERGPLLQLAAGWFAGGLDVNRNVP